MCLDNSTFSQKREHINKFDSNIKLVYWWKIYCSGRGEIEQRENSRCQMAAVPRMHLGIPRSLGWRGNPGWCWTGCWQRWPWPDLTLRARGHPEGRHRRMMSSGLGCSDLQPVVVKFSQTIGFLRLTVLFFVLRNDLKGDQRQGERKRYEKNWSFNILNQLYTVYPFNP